MQCAHTHGPPTGLSSITSRYPSPARRHDDDLIRVGHFDAIARFGFFSDRFIPSCPQRYDSRGRTIALFGVVGSRIGSALHD